jgi:HlyD family secretion protein
MVVKLKEKISGSRLSQLLKKRKAWILALVVILIAGSAAYVYFNNKQNAARAASATVVSQPQTTMVRRGNLRVSATGAGTLTANQEVDLSFSTSGTVAELNVKPGDEVKKGDVLAKLADTRELEANVASLEAQVIEAEQALKDLQDSSALNLAEAYQTMIDAQQTYNDALETSQRSSYTRCGKETNIQLAATLKRAKEDYDKLNNASFYGGDDWINAKNNYETALSNYNYCIAYTDDEKTSASASLDVAEVALKQAKEKYETLKENSGVDPEELVLAETTVEKAKLQLENAQDKLDGASIIASMNGTIISVAADAGESVSTGTYITLADLSQLYVDVTIDEADIEKMAVDEKAEVVFDAYPDKTFYGTVVSFDPEVSVSGQYTVATGVVKLDMAEEMNVVQYPLGLSATVEIISAEANNASLVSVDALVDLGDGEYGVFVKGDDQNLTFTNVEVGVMDDTYAEILEGLKPGDVVTTGTVKTIG